MTSLGLRRGHARAFQFAPNGVRSDFRLLEVNDELLAEICKDGVVIKGGEEEEAVLCTSKKTFAMKLVETTNLQLLVRPTQQDEQEKPSATPPGRPRGMSQGLQTQWNSFRTAEESAPVVVSATSTSHIELVEVAPRLAPLRQLLWQHPYGLQDEQVAEEAGPAAGEDGDGQEGGGDDGPQRKRRRTGAGGGGARGYTFEELLEVVQASPEQLLAALAAEGALLLRGRWRAVDRTYLGELLEHLLLAAEQEGMPLTGLREAPLAASLRGDGYHPAVVAHCLGVYGSRVLEEQGDKEGA